MTMYSTFLLDTDVWDLVLDISGNIALAAPPYSLAQDVASAIKLFLAELYYDRTKGVPYWENILGKLPPISVFQQYMNRAALTVPGVVTAQTIVQSFSNQTITGQVQFTDESGVTHVISF